MARRLHIQAATEAFWSVCSDMCARGSQGAEALDECGEPLWLESVQTTVETVNVVHGRRLYLMHTSAREMEMD